MSIRLLSDDEIDKMREAFKTSIENRTIVWPTAYRSKPRGLWILTEDLIDVEIISEELLKKIGKVLGKRWLERRGISNVE